MTLFFEKHDASIIGVLGYLMKAIACKKAFFVSTWELLIIIHFLYWQYDI